MVISSGNLQNPAVGFYGTMLIPGTIICVAAQSPVTDHHLSKKCNLQFNVLG
jgi:hypothetical protein